MNVYVQYLKHIPCIKSNTKDFGINNYSVIQQSNVKGLEKFSIFQNFTKIWVLEMISKPMFKLYS